VTDATGPISGPEGLPRVWTIEFFETDNGEKPVLKWIKEDLTPTKRRALGSAMRRVLQVHGSAVNRSAWGRPVAAGIFEFRVRMSGKEVINVEAEIHGISVAQARERFVLNPSEDVLLRVFCGTHGSKIVLLLHGYDKGEDPSARRQRGEIAEAVRRLAIVRARDARTESAKRKR
jgi:hypothetical protein